MWKWNYYQAFLNIVARKDYYDTVTQSVVHKLTVYTKWSSYQLLSKFLQNTSFHEHCLLDFPQQERLVLVQQEEKEMLEVQSTPLRNYLMRYVMPTLTQGLVEVCKVRPEDPVDYLVRFCNDI